MIKLLEKRINNMKRYYVACYPDKEMTRVVDNLMTDDFDIVLEFISKHVLKDEYIVAKNNITNMSADSDEYYKEINMYLDDDQLDVSFDIVADTFSEIYGGE